ncbi:MAG TPA: adenosylcobinamide-phosphate synthase CbiB [Xanthobacteraceae bacterium]|nr:adenosylcobinamide-phosphate synthase CbiB [Xanthobacteraceae bacterium]
MSLALTALALLIENYFGYPDRLLRSIGHPVGWCGRLITLLDKMLNHHGDHRAARRAAGVVALFLLLSVVGVFSFAASKLLLAVPYIGIVLCAAAASSLLAQRSLYEHVERVAVALEAEDLEAARGAVAHIVGRDTEPLDEFGVARAAIESLAENFSDGVVAPTIWMAIAGLPGAAIYKAINTADSMIGHRSRRYAHFGWASARLDDLVNLPASRFSALLLLAASLGRSGVSANAGARAVWRDAGRHRSPNAGWPEAAMAGALGLALAGPRLYGGKMVEDAMMGAGGRREATVDDIRAALALYRRADRLLVMAVAVLAVAFMPVFIPTWPDFLKF